MKVLVLGVNGMLGHKLYQVFSASFDVIGTIRGNYADIDQYGIFTESHIVPNINAMESPAIEKTIEQVRPDVVVNCIGIIKQRDQAQDRLPSIWMNSLFPHQLYRICHQREARLINMSTDCVFSGKKGNYRETDPPDAEDVYGKTKYLGEISGERVLTVRTSLIGRELATSDSLVEWFLANQGGKVNGFTNAIFSGFPTIHLAYILRDIILEHQNLSGVYHISAEPISKFNLLSLIKESMGLDIQIKAFPDFHCDRSLDSSLFQSETGFKPLPWAQMIDEFAEDAALYQRWRA
ncbi:MAG: SDR family oxidoreductase [Chloroflexota bacterium]|nr:SDR family oxidoreductase [Chloroflexota bacterium]